jgi:hypothetical protein
MNSLTGERLTFKEIERSFFEIGCEIAKTLMCEFLEKFDEHLCKNRNKAELRHKGTRETSIKTLMGEVPLSRRVYRRYKEDGSTEYVFLLDEEIGLDTIGLISPNLVEKALEHSCEMSYREVAKAVSNLTNQSISHQGVWNIVQAVGERQEKAEKDLINSFNENALSGSREIPVLFEEADGLWLSMQGKSRKRTSTSKGKRELKIGVMYEGWEKRYASSKEYKTVGKTAFAGYMKPDKFKSLRDAAVAKKYNVDEIVYRVLNGDGATWIRNGHDLETDVFQLDPYHLAKSVIRNVYDKQARRHILRWLKGGEIEKALSKIDSLKYECGGLENEVNKLTTLENYIKSNIDGIVVYKDRPGITLPEPPEGLEYRTLGTMERNVNIFAKRMNGAKSWSERGANNLAKIIALKMEKGFKDKISALVSGHLSERVTERFTESLSSSKVAVKKAVKRSLYPLHQGQLPFSYCKVTNGRKAIRRMFDLKIFSELVYR